MVAEPVEHKQWLRVVGYRFALVADPWRVCRLVEQGLLIAATTESREADEALGLVVGLVVAGL